LKFSTAVEEGDFYYVKGTMAPLPSQIRLCAKPKRLKFEVRKQRGSFPVLPPVREAL